MCGFIGVIGTKSAVHEIYDGLVAVQHRGQDAAGIITYDGRFHVKKGEGLVRDIFSAENMERLKGSIGVGHVRYPTVGSGGGEDAQPFTVNYPFGIVMAHNGNVANYEDLRGELAIDGRRFRDPEHAVVPGRVVGENHDFSGLAFHGGIRQNQKLPGVAGAHHGYPDILVGVDGHEVAVFPRGGAFEHEIDGDILRAQGKDHLRDVAGGLQQDEMINGVG